MTEIDLSTIDLAPSRNRFALRMVGDLMLGRHICDGDVVVFNHREEPEHGDVVAALVLRKNVIKTYVVKAESEALPDLIPTGELVIVGVMVALARRLLL